ncbi:MAG TPA: FAD-binding oxidoreductase [Acidimicrobiales bacterium]|nr:FAD-binding oxidoreductase [Acidimicrobiales bacterium]
MNVTPLAAIVGREHVLTEPSLIERYVVDWTGRFRGSSPAVVRPASAEEVASIVQWCGASAVALVPQGGNTGLVGGSVPLRGEIVVSLERLRTIDSVDEQMGHVIAGAGVTIGDARRAARDAGWDYGVDWSARDTATVGGSIATNAGGTKVARHGDTRAQLLGLEAVLGDGSTIAHLTGLLKDNTGYHLPSLLCGSEGTLGVVTRAQLRLVPQLPARVVALVGLRSADAALAATATLRRALPSVEAIELFFRDGLELVRARFGLPEPLGARADAYLLVECADRVDPTDELAAVVDDLGAVDVAVASTDARRAELWRYREAHTEAINAIGPPHKLDVTLPGTALAAFVAEVPARVGAVVRGARVWLFGHAADGNLHVNVTGVDPADDRVDDAVLSLVASHGGSISAEHGIGSAKKRWLHLNRSSEEIAAMRSIKQALDPAGILNPNVLLP